MLSPDELKNQTFTRVMRGFSAVEVTEYLEFVAKKYSELYEENVLLNRKLESAQERLDKVHDAEITMRSNVENAEQTAEQIIATANERAAEVKLAVKHNCEAILREFHQKLLKQKDLLDAMQEQVELFKNTVFGEYSAHMKKLEALVVRSESLAEYEPDYTSEVFRRVRSDIENNVTYEEEADEEDIEIVSRKRADIFPKS